MSPNPGAGQIHIALTFDDGFWAPAYATMRSICLATHRRRDLVFHLCHRPLSPEHRADLMEIEAEFGATLRFYDLTQTPQFRELMGKVPYHKRLTDIVYARFVLESFLPADIERIIYLDCDMMVMAPIEGLWEADLGGKPAAAVPEPWGKLIGSGRDIAEKSDLLDPADPYFNAGLLVLDLERWREADVFGKLQTLISDGSVDRLSYSQNVINLILKNNWQPLDTLWNVIDPHRAHVSLNPYNLHYTGDTRPWTLTAGLRGVGYARIYRHMMTNELFYRFWRYRMKKQLGRYLPFIETNRGALASSAQRPATPPAA